MWEGIVAVIIDKEAKMLINDAIDNCYDQNFSISTFLLRLLRIAEKIEDPILKFLVRLESIDVDTKENNRIRMIFKREMIETGITNEEFNKVYQSLLIDWLKRREVETKGDEVDSNIWGKAISSLEITINAIQEQNDLFIIPDKLAPIDTYNLNEQYTKLKTKNLELITQLKEILQRTKVFFFNYLTEIEAENESGKNKVNITEVTMPINNQIFIIHGANEAKWRELSGMLSEMDLNPIVLSEKTNAANTLIDKFEKYAKDCSAAVAILSADDLVEDKQGKQYLQARPNVWFELGWFYSKLGKDRVLLVYEEEKDNVIPSDLQGVVQLRYVKNVQEIYRPLSKEFEAMGIGRIEGSPPTSSRE